MGNTESSPRHQRRASKREQLSDSFRGAGCLFTNGKTVLAGYQRKRGDIIISGLGGSRQEHETFIETALRETIEELFDIKEVPSKLLEGLKDKLRPASIKGKEVPDWGIYVQLVYTFEDLQVILKYVERAAIKSPLYESFPRTISDLLLKRNPHRRSSSPEIEYLTIIPVDTAYMDAPIKPEFIEDCRNLKTNP